MAGTALITGASGGIGREFARLHAAHGGDLIIVARREEALEALKTELEAAHGVNVRVIAADLSVPGAAAEVHAALDGAQVDILINNAGFGGHGPFHEQDLSRNRAMIALNVGALTELTRLLLPGMMARGHGRILNVSSMAGFLPGPLMAVYYATKAYVISFSQALAEETRGAGVSVTVLCPGPVRTGFAETAGMQGVKVVAHGVAPERTARAGYRAMLRGHRVAFDDWRLRLVADWIVPCLPRRLLAFLSLKSMEKR